MITNWFYIEKLITKFKVFYIQIGHTKETDIFSLHIFINRPNIDHYGIGLNIEFIRIFIYFKIYDIRHKEDLYEL